MALEEVERVDQVGEVASDRHKVDEGLERLIVPLAIVGLHLEQEGVGEEDPAAARVAGGVAIDIKEVLVAEMVLNGGAADLFAEGV